MFDGFINSLKGIQGTSQGKSLASNSLQTKGFTGPGAAGLAKGAMPTNSVDKLRLANALKGGGMQQAKQAYAKAPSGSGGGMTGNLMKSVSPASAGPPGGALGGMLGGGKLPGGLGKLGGLNAGGLSAPKYEHPLIGGAKAMLGKMF